MIRCNTARGKSDPTLLDQGLLQEAAALLAQSPTVRTDHPWPTYGLLCLAARRIRGRARRRGAARAWCTWRPSRCWTYTSIFRPCGPGARTMAWLCAIGPGPLRHRQSWCRWSNAYAQVGLAGSKWL